VKLVLDASAVLSGVTIPCTDELLMPPLVEAELGHAWVRRKLDYLKEVCLRVLEPSRAAVEAIKAKCRETGDDARLSDADIHVLALARESGATILTDDYSIQNIARSQGIPYRPVSQKGIGAVFIWKYRCSGCKKFFETALKECPVCGAEVRSYRGKAAGRRQQAAGDDGRRRTDEGQQAGGSGHQGTD